MEKITLDGQLPLKNHELNEINGQQRTSWTLKNELPKLLSEGSDVQIVSGTLGSIEDTGFFNTSFFIVKNIMI